MRRHRTKRVSFTTTVTPNNTLVAMSDSGFAELLASCWTAREKISTAAVPITVAIIMVAMDSNRVLPTGYLYRSCRDMNLAVKKMTVPENKSSALSTRLTSTAKEPDKATATTLSRRKK